MKNNEQQSTPYSRENYSKAEADLAEIRSQIETAGAPFTAQLAEIDKQREEWKSDERNSFAEFPLADEEHEVMEKRDEVTITERLSEVKARTELNHQYNEAWNKAHHDNIEKDERARRKGNYNLFIPQVKMRIEHTQEMLTRIPEKNIWITQLARDIEEKLILLLKILSNPRPSLTKKEEEYLTEELDRLFEDYDNLEEKVHTAETNPLLDK